MIERRELKIPKRAVLGSVVRLKFTMNSKGKVFAGQN
jgi:hypothetical protein